MCLLATSEFSHDAVKKHQETVITALKVTALSLGFRNMCLFFLFLVGFEVSYCRCNDFWEIFLDRARRQCPPARRWPPLRNVRSCQCGRDRPWNAVLPWNGWLLHSRRNGKLSDIWLTFIFVVVVIGWNWNLRIGLDCIFSCLFCLVIGEFILVKCKRAAFW